MEDKKLYICGDSCNKKHRKVYDSIEQLKLENLLWEELGIYELKISDCISEPSFFNEDNFNMKKIEKQKQDNTIKNNSNAVKLLFEKASQLFKKKHEPDWVDVDGIKQFKWSGKCDGCNKLKDNLTVLYSATLSGVTICRECREGIKRNETSKG